MKRHMGVAALNIVWGSFDPSKRRGGGVTKREKKAQNFQLQVEKEFSASESRRIRLWTDPLFGTLAQIWPPRDESPGPGCINLYWIHQKWSKARPIDSEAFRAVLRDYFFTLGIKAPGFDSQLMAMDTSRASIAFSLLIYGIRALHHLSLGDDDIARTCIQQCLSIQHSSTKRKSW